MVDYPRPPWESDPREFSAGRSFDVAWLIGGTVADAECVVYQVFEQGNVAGRVADDPVYVGITRDFPARWGEHKAHSWWFRRMNPLSVIVAGYPTRLDALKVEATLIAQHRPIFNRKAERTHLAMARDAPPAPEIYMAELHVRREVSSAHSEYQAGVLAV